MEILGLKTQEPDFVGHINGKFIYKSVHIDV